jgi:hypothetical protein
MSSARSTAALLALGGGLACAPGETHVTFPPGFDSGTEVLVIDGGDALTVYAFSLDTRAIDIPLDPSWTAARVEALHYGAGFAKLGFLPDQAGALASVPTGRPLPQPLAIYDADLRTEGGRWTSGGWQTATTLSAKAAAFRIAPLDWPTCAASGGCASAEGVCLPSCATSTPAAPLAPAPPAAAALPSFEPCPAGWVLGAQDPPTCDPLAAADRPRCSAGAAQFVGTATCAPLGTECPAAGAFADATSLAPGRRAVYIRPGARGGAGTEALPYGSVAEAVAAGAVTSGAALVLSAGTFSVDAPSLRQGLVWLGACASGTVLAPTAGLLVASGSSVALLNLTVEAPPYISVAAGATLSLDGVLIDHPSDDGLLVQGALSAHRIAIRSGFGHGIAISASGTATIAQAVLDGAAGAGLLVSDSARAGVQDLVVLSTGEHGIAVTDAAVLTLERALIDGAGQDGLRATSSATISVSNLVVRSAGRLLGAADEAAGAWITGPGQVVIARALFDQSLGAGIRAATVALALSDVVVRDTAASQPALAPTTGIGIALGAAVRLDARRILVERSADSGLGVDGHALSARVLDLTVRGGGGIYAGQHQAVRLSRVHTEATSNQAFFVEYGDATIVEDLSVDGVLTPTGPRACGLRLGASSTVSRVSVQGVATGARVHGTTARIEDLLVEGFVEPDPLGIEDGSGVLVFERTTLHLERAVVHAPPVAGLAVYVGAAARAADVAINGAGRSAVVASCAGGACTLGLSRVQLSGAGLVLDGTATSSATALTVDGAPAACVQASDGAALLLSDFLLEGCGAAGVALMTAASVQLEDGRISSSAVGVQSDAAFDPEQFLRGVRYQNDRIDFSHP